MKEGDTQNEISRRKFLQGGAAASLGILAGGLNASGIAEPLDIDRKREELKTHPEYFEGIRTIRNYVDEKNVRHKVYETVAITKSGAWIIEQDAYIAEDEAYAPYALPKLVKELMRWGPNSFEQDLQEIEEEARKAQ